MSSFQPLDPSSLTQENPTQQPPASEQDVVLSELYPVALESDDPAERGYMEGFRAGIQQAEQQTQSLLAALNASGTEYAAFQAADRRNLEDQAALLACELACALADAHLDLNPELIKGVVKGALNDAGSSSSAVLLVSPDDLALLDGEDIASLGQHLTIRPDPRIARGGCRVESAAGDIDATRQGRYDQLRGKVNELIRQREQ